MDGTHATGALLVFRRPGSAAEQEAADRLCHWPAGTSCEAAVTYGLTEIAPAHLVAAVVVGGAGGTWRLLAAGGESEHFGRMAGELVRSATAAGAVRLVAAPDAPAAVRAIFLSSPIAPSVVEGWHCIDL